MVKPLQRAGIAVAGAALFACQPETIGGVSLIDSPQVLAIRSDPAEVVPNKSVTLTALYVGPRIDPDPGVLDWALCGLRKPIAVSGHVALECLAPEGEGLTQLGRGESVRATLPMDDCRVFGPSTPVPKPGEPPARPADPDSTGGYYQPTRLLVPGVGQDDYVVGLTRISCGLSGATQEQVADYTKRYRANNNPVIGVTLAQPGAGQQELSNVESEPTEIKIGASLTLRTVWDDCPVQASCGDGYCTNAETTDSCPGDCKTPTICGGSEAYVVLDPVTHALVDRRESMRVSWFADGGAFAHDRSGRAEDEANVPFSDNRWTAPAEAGTVRLWVVLRDDRGGVGYSSYYLRVK